jgi:hypothetical protein
MRPGADLAQRVREARFGRELWTWFVVIALLLLVAESVIARWCMSGREAAGEASSENAHCCVARSLVAAEYPMDTPRSSLPRALHCALSDTAWDCRATRRSSVSKSTSLSAGA